MNTKTTTTRIIPADRDILKEKFGKPVYLAIHKIIEEARDTCEHPDFAQVRATGIISTDINAALTDDMEKRDIVWGFYCRKCANYVFPSLQLEVEA